MPEPLAWVRRADGDPYDVWWSERSRAVVAGALGQFDPELVVLDGPGARRTLELAGIAGRTTALLAHNVEGDLHEQLAEAARVPGGLARLVAERIAATEAALVAGVDQVWACSAHDAALLADRYRPCAPVHVVPNTSERLRSQRRVLEPPMLLFIGALGYAPNVEAARWLGEELLPLLRREGTEVSLRLIGAPVPPEIAALAADERIEVLGFVGDLEPHLEQASVVPVPLRAGSGTRLKVLEAFAAGVPVVASAKAIEGIGARAGEHYLAAEGAEDFAAAIRWLLRDADLAERLALAARALVEREHSPAALDRALARALGAIPA
jgi:glycosyltransferase involved in cell wall biosynthesis